MLYFVHYRHLRYFGLLATFTLCLASCDTARILIVKNRSPYPARFSMADRFGKGQDSTLIKLLAPKGRGRSSQVTFYYGIGGWDDTSVTRFTRYTTWLELASRTDTLRLNTREQIRRLLQDNREGVFKSRVVLKIR